MKKLLEIFKIFLKVGAFTFGGGYAMIPLIEREMVEKQGWISEEDIVDIFAVSESIPGSIAINSATFIGYKISGYWGAVLAMLGVILPSFMVIMAIAVIFAKFQDLPVVKAAFEGIRGAVVALIAIAALKVGKAGIKDRIGLALMVIAFGLLVFAKFHAILIILLGAVAGLLMSWHDREGKEGEV